MKIPVSLRVASIALFAILLGWGARVLAQALGWLPGGDPVPHRIDVNLARAAIAMVAIAAGLGGFTAMLAGLLAALWHRPVEVIEGPLRTERQSDGCRVLLCDLRLEVGGHVVRVPRGTVTDFSTIPWIGRMLVRWSRVDLAGVTHDWLYEQGPPDWTRAQADRIWRDVALAGDHRANPFQAWVAWLALWAFGRIAWRRHRNKTARKCVHELDP